MRRVDERELDAMVPQLIRERDRPMVVDADALNAMAGQGDAWHVGKAPAVITPHPGELGRLMKKSTAEIQANRRAVATQCARATGLIVVLKGQGTVVTDGDRVAGLRRIELRDPFGNRIELLERTAADDR